MGQKCSEACFSFIKTDRSNLSSHALSIPSKSADSDLKLHFLDTLIMPTFKFYESVNMTQSGTAEYSIFPTLYDGELISETWNYIELESSRFEGQYRGSFQYSGIQPSAGTLTEIDHYRIL